MKELFLTPTKTPIAFYNPHWRTSGATKLMRLYDNNEEPKCDDTVKCCPDCETPNQFGELCGRCLQDRQAEAQYDAEEDYFTHDKINREFEYELNLRRYEWEQEVKRENLLEDAYEGLEPCPVI